MKKILWITAISIALLGCADDSADKNGDGKIDPSERTSEMQSDAFISVIPGLWETKMQFTKIDIPTVTGKAKEDMLRKLSQNFSSRSCISKEDAQKPDADFFGGKGSEDCIYKRFDMSGENAEIIVSCKVDSIGETLINLSGSIQAKQHNFKTIINMKMPSLGKVALEGTAKREHIGACPSA